MNETDWKQQLLNSTLFNKKQEQLLKNCAKSLTDSWQLGALYTRQKKMNGYREPPTPNYQISFLEWERKLAKGEFYALLEDDVL